MMFLVWEDSFHLILRDDKTWIQNPNTRSPVTGGVKHGETFLQAMQRELKAETGLVLSNITRIGVSDKRNCFFFARITGEQKESIILGEGQSFDFYQYSNIPDDTKGAFRKYLDRFPEIFRRMCEDKDFIPVASDLGLNP
jgi:8-oxo-dGTP pyrophosphatase MutT (NUDIX family)